MDINGMNQMYESLGISREVREFAAETEKALRESKPVNVGWSSISASATSCPAILICSFAIRALL